MLISLKTLQSRRLTPLAHLISEILDSYGLGTPLRCKYFLLGLTVFIFTLCFSLQIFLLVISKRIRLQILSTPAPVTVHDVGMFVFSFEK